MIGSVISKNGVPIRLTEERWFHIVENHDELVGMAYEVLDAIQNPESIVKGEDEIFAIKRMKDKYLVVVYKEMNKTDGFVITAFLTNKVDKIKRREFYEKGTE